MSRNETELISYMIVNIKLSTLNEFIQVFFESCFEFWSILRNRTWNRTRSGIVNYTFLILCGVTFLFQTSNFKVTVKIIFYFISVDDILNVVKLIV